MAPTVTERILWTVESKAIEVEVGEGTLSESVTSDIASREARDGWTVHQVELCGPQAAVVVLKRAISGGGQG